MHDLGVAFVGTLGEDHLHKLGDYINTRIFKVALLPRAYAAGTSWNVRDRVAGGGRLLEEIASHRVEPARIGERGQLDRAELRGGCLPWNRRRYNSVLRDSDSCCIGGDRDRRQHCVTLRSHYRSLIVHVEAARPGISDRPIRLRYLKEAGALDSKVERIARLIEVSLRHAHLGCSGPGSQAYLPVRCNGLLTLR